MKKALSTIIQYVVFLGLGLWLIYHMIHGLKPDERDQLVYAIKSVNLWLLIPVFIAGFLSHLFRAMRWRLLLETINAKPTLPNTLFAVLIGYILNLFIPRAGEVAKCTVLAKYEKLPTHKMVGTIVSERAFDIFCLVIITIIAFLLQASIIGQFAADQYHKLGHLIKTNETAVIIVICVLAILILVLILIYRKHRENKIGHFIKELAHGVLSIFHMKKRWTFIGYTFLIWLMYSMQIYLGFLALPATAHLSILAALVVLVYGSVAMILTPGGIGAYTSFVAQILVYYAISEVYAQAFGWIAWGAQTSILIILGIVSLLVIHPYNTRRNAKAAVDKKQNI